MNECYRAPGRCSHNANLPPSQPPAGGPTTHRASVPRQPRRTLPQRGRHRSCSVPPDRGTQPCQSKPSPRPLSHVHNGLPESLLHRGLGTWCPCCSYCRSCGPAGSGCERRLPKRLRVLPFRGRAGPAPDWHPPPERASTGRCGGGESQFSSAVKLERSVISVCTVRQHPRQVRLQGDHRHREGGHRTDTNVVRSSKGQCLLAALGSIQGQHERCSSVKGTAWRRATLRRCRSGGQAPSNSKRTQSDPISP